MLFAAHKPYKTEILSFLLFYLVVCLFILAYSPTVLLYVGHDVGPVLDGVWRLENGQAPHKDFPSILGVGYLWQQAFFLRLFRYGFVAFAVSSIAITTLALLVFLSFYSSERFVKNTGLPLRVYLFLLLVSLGLGQYHFGVGHTLVTYANLYNRYCFLCLFVLFLQTLLLGGAKPGSTATVLRLLLIALLLNYLFFVKLTYFAVAAGLLTLCWALAIISFNIYWRLWAAGVLVFAAVCLLTKVDVPALLNDYRTFAAARSGELLQPAFFRYKLVQYYNLAFLFALALLVAGLLRRKAPRKVVVLIVFTGVCALALQFTNWGATDIVLLCFVPAVFVLFSEYRSLLAYKIFIALCCVFLFKNMRSIYSLSKAKENGYTELKSRYLSGFYTNFTETACKEDYATRVMSGVQLVDSNKAPGDKVFPFSFDNPFPFLTHTVPPKGTPTVWQYATTYTDKVYTAPAVLFTDVNLLLVPTCLKAESATEMMRLYGATVRRYFSAVDSNGYWVLYRKTVPF